MTKRINKLRHYKIVSDIVRDRYMPGLTTYAGVWRQYVYPFYPMSYQTFMRIVNYPRLNLELKELEEQSEAKKPVMSPTPFKQLDLFEKYKVDDKSLES